jgi:ankyrin repeat protein
MASFSYQNQLPVSGRISPNLLEVFRPSPTPSGTTSSPKRKFHAPEEWLRDGDLVSLAQAIEAAPEALRDWRSYNGSGLLHLAASYGQVDAIHYLMGLGIFYPSNLSYSQPLTNYGDTPLHLAARYGKLDCISALVLRYRHPIDPISNRGSTPCHEAVKTNQPEALVLLQMLGALGFFIPDGQGKLPVYYACTNAGLLKVLGGITSPSPFDILDGEGVSTFIMACKMGDADCITAISNSSPMSILKTRDGEGTSPLGIVVKRGVPEMVEVMLSVLQRIGATSVHYTCPDKFGYTPLHHAAKGGRVDICEMLLKSGCRRSLTKQTCTKKYFPVDLALSHGCWKTARLLLCVSPVHRLPIPAHKKDKIVPTPEEKAQVSRQLLGYTLPFNPTPTTTI